MMYLPDDGQPILLPYQARWNRDRSPVAVMEKSRRIGMSWSDAGERAIHAAQGTGDVYYMSYNKDMTEGYIRDAAEWACRFEAAVGDIAEETFLVDGRPEHRFRLPTASGRSVVAMNSNPRVARSKGRPGDVLIVDEAAFCDDLGALLKSALAFTMWGGLVRVMSTHNGADNPFAELVDDIRAGRLPYSLHRTTLDDALRDGLGRRLCSVRREEWDDGWEQRWRAGEIAKYRSAEERDEELFCVPRQGGGAWLSRALVESRMAPAPILRFAGDAPFNALPEDRRREAVEDWLRDEVDPALAGLDADRRHAVGWDFARSGDTSSLSALEIGATMRRTCRLLVEMRNVPHAQQVQVAGHVCDRLPRFAGGAVDATGVGSYAAEAMVDRYGSLCEAVAMSESWYRAEMPPYKAALEDDELLVPLNDDVLEDHRALRLVRGVPRLPQGKTDAAGRRHGDSAISLALAHYASRREGGPPEFASSGPREAVADLEGWGGDSRRPFAGWQ